LPIWDGGLGIWGGIAAGTLAGPVDTSSSRRRHPRFLDAAAPALLAAQAIRPVGNYFTGSCSAARPTSRHRPRGYEHYATFH
jgi:prolipoprotein diacylglyceryltransferase